MLFAVLVARRRLGKRHDNARIISVGASRADYKNKVRTLQTCGGHGRRISFLGEIFEDFGDIPEDFWRN